MRILKADRFHEMIGGFERGDESRRGQAVSKAESWAWLDGNIPLFECPDSEIERTYYFRWWVYQKHVKDTPAGTVISEFLPDVSWAGRYNTINCAAGHHLYEGRWLARRTDFLEPYARFWFRGGGNPRAYSTWLADALWNLAAVSGDFSLMADLLPDLDANYQAWEESQLHASGLFWSSDDRDGMEFSISGSGLRPTLNAYLWADARAIARTAALVGQAGLESAYLEKATRLKQRIEERLWDEQAQFFKTIPLESRDARVPQWDFRAQDPAHNVRELAGYVPWYFDLPAEDFETAWRELFDPQGFYAPYGPTTAERRHPRFRFQHDSHECLWNGPSWPFATSQVIAGMIQQLQRPGQTALHPGDFLAWMKRYAHCHQRIMPDGRVTPWLDENLDPFSGEWLSRAILEGWGWPAEKGGRERGKDYNHSSFNDLVIRGLVGLQPGEGDQFELHPLVPEGAWEYFCLDGLAYHGHELTVLFDASGKHYGMGAGLRVWVDGRQAGWADRLAHLKAPLAGNSDLQPESHSSEG